MIWLEMSRDKGHGGEGWEFATCLWSPTEKKGGGKWAYWDLMQRIHEGDVVLHLRGKTNPEFTGHSIADTNCYRTDKHPPRLGSWGHANSFYRVPLRDYCPFEKPILLADVFARCRDRLTEYHGAHSPAHSRNGRLLFYVQQAGRLQCQNGAYLSELDAELIQILFGSSSLERDFLEVSTGSSLTTLFSRIGQPAFSQAVRENYSEQCCFPDCAITDREFLVGAHIARWSDSPKFRGDITNGLCLCLMHDKAFEVGLFVLDQHLRVIPTPLAAGSPWATANILPYANRYIKDGQLTPALTCLQLHWQRVGFMPEVN